MIVVPCCSFIAFMLCWLICVFLNSNVLRLHTGTTVKILVLKYWHSSFCAQFFLMRLNWSLTLPTSFSLSHHYNYLAIQTPFAHPSFWLFFNQLIINSHEQWFDSKQLVSLYNDQYCCCCCCCLLHHGCNHAALINLCICSSCTLTAYRVQQIRILVLEYWHRISWVHNFFGTIHIHSTLLFAEQRYYQTVLIHLSILSWFGTHHAACQSIIFRFRSFFSCLMSSALIDLVSELFLCGCWSFGRTYSGFVQSNGDTALCLAS